MENEYVHTESSMTTPTAGSPWWLSVVSTLGFPANAYADRVPE
jgi:hypothetical protein